MGIKNLHTFLRKMDKSLYDTIDLKTLSGKTLAVDTSIFMCKYKSMLGKRWLNGFWNLALCMRNNNVNLIFIYDSKAPPEKDAERLLRQEQREKQRNKVNNIMDEWMCVEKKLMITNEELDRKDFLEKIKDYEFLYKFLLRNDFNNRYEIINLLHKVEKTLITINIEDFDLSKKLLTTMGYKCENAYGEAEATCAFLNRIGTVDGVLTEDTDVLAYRTPIMFHNLSIKDNTVMQINIKDILEKLDLKENEFLDFCILCGTDYNRNLNMIGPQKSFQLIKKYGTIDKFNIEDKLINSKAKIELRELNYIKIQKLFNPDYNYVADDTCKEIDMKELKNFCFYNNLNFELLN